MFFYIWAICWHPAHSQSGQVQQTYVTINVKCIGHIDSLGYCQYHIGPMI